MAVVTAAVKSPGICAGSELQRCHMRQSKELQDVGAQVSLGAVGHLNLVAKGRVGAGAVGAGGGAVPSLSCRRRCGACTERDLMHVFVVRML